MTAKGPGVIGVPLPAIPVVTEAYIYSIEGNTRREQIYHAVAETVFHGELRTVGTGRAETALIACVAALADAMVVLA